MGLHIPTGTLTQFTRPSHLVGIMPEEKLGVYINLSRMICLRLNNNVILIFFSALLIFILAYLIKLRTAMFEYANYCICMDWNMCQSTDFKRISYIFTNGIYTYSIDSYAARKC